ncbi:hypothetical protein BKA67DRAFT_120342 [Truncatella angustata]|uniref:Uncharacterized protein n=1 Tax=Truncatella angustata TaxID=152316 RepID=A0A9P8UCC8_9PEZI|nr:uncharacterized protein BKA67DRAFT_120342 [Truncatella angustata]KAH6645622.1 hypothetical protein BKA67DRAFT_120342 [Truncatella angustata]
MEPSRSCAISARPTGNEYINSSFCSTNSTSFLFLSPHHHHHLHHRHYLHCLHYLHPPSPTFTRLHPPSPTFTTFTHLHPPSPAFTHLHPPSLPSPTFTHLHPPSPTFTRLHPPSPTLITLITSACSISLCFVPADVVSRRFQS